jgi:hypothetical protein
MELVPLCELELTLGARLADLDGPRGHRGVLEVDDIKVTGQRLNGKLKSSWVDSSLVNGNVITLDVRGVIETDDGATIYVTYLGRADLTTPPEDLYFYCSPQFETDHPDYLWINSIQGAGKGKVTGGTMHYDWYEMR